MTISNPLQGVASPWFGSRSPLMQPAVLPGMPFGSTELSGNSLGTTQTSPFLASAGLFTQQPIDSFSMTSPFSTLSPFSDASLYSPSLSSPYGSSDLSQSVFALLSTLQSLLGNLLGAFMGQGSANSELSTNGIGETTGQTGSGTGGESTSGATDGSVNGAGNKGRCGGHKKHHCGGKDKQSENGGSTAGTEQSPETNGLSMQSTLPESTSDMQDTDLTGSPAPNPVLEKTGPATDTASQDSDNTGTSGVTIDHNGFNDAQVAQLQKYIDFLSHDADGAKLLAAANKDGAGITLKYAPDYKAGGAGYNDNTILITDSFLQQMGENSDYPIFALTHEMVHAASDDGDSPAQDHYGKTEEVLASVVGDRVKARYIGQPEGPDGDRNSYNHWLEYSNNDSYYGSLADNPEARQELESKGITFNL